MSKTGSIQAETLIPNSGTVKMITASMDTNGNQTSYTYDGSGLPVKKADVLSVKNALGNTESFVYDANGRIKTVTDKNGNVTGYVHDANGNIWIGYT